MTNMIRDYMFKMCKCYEEIGKLLQQQYGNDKNYKDLDKEIIKYLEIVNKLENEIDRLLEKLIY